MKRVLLATTALCVGAGMAAAEVALSGNAEMGVVGSKDDSERFHTDVNVKFSLSGETQGGVTFGTEIELSDIEDADGRKTTNDDDEHGGIAVHISDPDGFGTLTMGDTDGAYDWALSEIVGVGGGSINDAQEHGAYDGNGGLDGTFDGQILRWDRAIASGFSLGASVELDDDTDGEPDGAESDTFNPVLGVGVKYEMGMGLGKLGLGGGFQTTSYDGKVEDVNDVLLAGAEVDAAIFGGSVSMDFTNGGDGLKVIANASMMDADGSATVNDITGTVDIEQTYLGVGLGYHIGDIELGLNAASKVTEGTADANSARPNDSATVEETVTGVGFAATYDLGGGASLQFGVGSSETEVDYTYGSALSQYAGNSTGEDSHDSSSDTNKWSLGVAFSF